MTTSDRLRWVLDFVNRNLDTEKPGALLDLRNDVFPVLHEPFNAMVSGSSSLRGLGKIRTAEDVGPVLGAARALLADVQSRLREGLDLLERGAMWRPFGNEAAPGWIVEPVAKGRFARSYFGTWAGITTAVAADLIVDHWADIRRCANPDCRRWFLPTHGRQRFHDPHCSWIVRYARFRPKRDYKTEYSRRYETAKTKRRRGRPRGAKRS
jgi:hypothetical protein